jgi:2-keto-3-deoxy-L-fuconate dehydrogenase
VTGAAGGIGFAAARAFAEAGYQVIASDVDARRLEDAAARIGATPLPLDATSPEQVRLAAESDVLRDGLQALVVAHGIAGARGFFDLDESFVSRNLAVNGTSVRTLVEGLRPVLERGAPSSIAIVASQAGIKAEAQNSAYSAAKFAVMGLVQGLVPLLRPAGVRIHALCPGCVDTPLLTAALEGFARASGISYEEFSRRRAAGIPLNRFASPDEMGSALLYLCQLDHSGLVFAPTGGETLT